MGHAALLVHRDHPRVCGEEACMQCTLQGHGGSPPRMRGRASAWPPVLRPPKDHPRVCGEKKSGCVPGRGKVGSPPRMRGKGFFQRLLVLPSGITPAYAGKRGPVRRNGDLEPGSPPRMRGKAQRRAGSASGSGITPAYAGKRLCRLFGSCFLGDHPRVCGEKDHRRSADGGDAGSPPRMRGKVGRCRHRSPCFRITPAYAGKSKRIAPSSVLFGDHPRVCGEKHLCGVVQLCIVGSPPRMRGKD